MKNEWVYRHLQINKVKIEDDFPGFLVKAIHRNGMVGKRDTGEKTLDYENVEFKIEKGISMWNFVSNVRLFVLIFPQFRSIVV